MAVNLHLTTIDEGMKGNAYDFPTTTSVIEHVAEGFTLNDTDSIDHNHPPVEHSLFEVSSMGNRKLLSKSKVLTSLSKHVKIVCLVYVQIPAFVSLHTQLTRVLINYSSIRHSLTRCI